MYRFLLVSYLWYVPSPHSSVPLLNFASRTYPFLAESDAFLSSRRRSPGLKPSLRALPTSLRLFCIHVILDILPCTLSAPTQTSSNNNKVDYLRSQIVESEEHMEHVNYLTQRELAKDRAELVRMHNSATLYATASSVKEG